MRERDVQEDPPRQTGNSIRGSRISMKARHSGTCRVCHAKVYAGDGIFFFPRTGAVEHYNCANRRNHTIPASLSQPREAIPVRPPGHKASALDEASLRAQRDRARVLARQARAERWDLTG